LVPFQFRWNLTLITIEIIFFTRLKFLGEKNADLWIQMCPMRTCIWRDIQTFWRWGQFGVSGMPMQFGRQGTQRGQPCDGNPIRRKKSNPDDKIMRKWEQLLQHGYSRTYKMRP
jgi:hypothetical protein